MKKTAIIIITLIHVLATNAENGSELWLRGRRNYNTAHIKTTDRSATAMAAVKELSVYWHGQPISLIKDKDMPDNDGFAIESTKKDKRLTIRARRSSGLLYGAYELLRMQGTGRNDTDISIRQTPAFRYRIIRHDTSRTTNGGQECDGPDSRMWNEINGSKGTMSLNLKEKLTLYCRASASTGINGIALTDRNCRAMTAGNGDIDKVKVIADLFRIYGIKIYLATDLSAITKLQTTGNASTTGNDARQWLKEKAREIYRKIPDFGGFIINTYPEHGTSGSGMRDITAEGTAMLAEALMPHKGIVITEDHFHSLENDETCTPANTGNSGNYGHTAAANMALMLSNGTSGDLPDWHLTEKTDTAQAANIIIDLQPTVVLNGKSHMPEWLAPAWRRSLGSTATTQAVGITVTFQTDDIDDIYRCCMTSANWYASGRLAWNPSLPSDSIAAEWLCLTFSTDTAFVKPMARVLEDTPETSLDDIRSHVSTWQRMRPYVDKIRFDKISAALGRQLKDAEEWINECVRVFKAHIRRSQQPCMDMSLPSSCCPKACRPPFSGKITYYAYPYSAIIPEHGMRKQDKSRFPGKPVRLFNLKNNNYVNQHLPFSDYPAENCASHQNTRFSGAQLTC